MGHHKIVRIAVNSQSFQRDKGLHGNSDLLSSFTNQIVSNRYEKPLKNSGLLTFYKIRYLFKFLISRLHRAFVYDSTCKRSNVTKNINCNGVKKLSTMTPVFVERLSSGVRSHTLMGGEISESYIGFHVTGRREFCDKKY